MLAFATGTLYFLGFAGTDIWPCALVALAPMAVAMEGQSPRRCLEIGAIAGTVAFGLGRMVTRLPKPNDGVVCVDETNFPALRDHLALPVGHTVMLASPRVARQTAAFLRTGAFRR